ncbi:MAG: histidinol dehydrogenase, partial [Desulfovibrionaceae bacterium]|nr:histidinol dehydrogenase [Desulfovibrionaceae bacterium]
MTQTPAGPGRTGGQTGAGLIAGAPSLVPDDRFAAAYDATTPMQRGWLKTTVRYLFELHHDHRRGEATQSASYAGGFAVSRLARPKDFALVLTPGPTAAPARLLAAALPALLAGVPEVAVASLDGKLSGPALTALELAGLETALETTPARFAELVRGLGETSARGLILLLAPGALKPGIAAALASSPNIEVWSAPPPRLAVLAAPRTRWDYAALALAHGGSPVEVYGPAPGELPANCVPRPGGLAELLDARPLAA